MCGDHPRIRGEHERHRLFHLSLCWIIPAYAGSTFYSDSDFNLYEGSSPHTRGAPYTVWLQARIRGDHPRIRGEHYVLMVCLLIDR